MSGNKNALVLLWTGNEMPEDMVMLIKDILIKNGITIPEYLVAVYKDAEGIANSLVKEADGISTFRIDIADNQVAEALKQAIIFIGTRFEASLINAKGNNLAQFTLELHTAVQSAHNNIGFNPYGGSEQERALVKAVKLISTTSAVIPSSLARKYHITKQVCDVIKLVHNQFA